MLLFECQINNVYSKKKLKFFKMKDSQNSTFLSCVTFLVYQRYVDFALHFHYNLVNGIF